MLHGYVMTNAELVCTLLATDTSW